MTTPQLRDLVILDVPDTARAAHARLLAAPEAAEFTVGAADVAIGPLEALPGSGLLVAVDDLAEPARLAQRRGLPVAPSGERVAGTVDGLVLGLVGPTVPRTAQPSAEIVGIDHIVLTSPNRDRIIATLCGRLDFDLRLDRVQPWGVHQLFLRRGELLVEVVLTEGEAVNPSEPDVLWGIAWRTTDADATRDRLTQHGLAVSEVRRGAKPGTRVATVKDPELGIATVVLEQA